jgi:hypothetical protein
MKCSMLAMHKCWYFCSNLLNDQEERWFFLDFWTLEDWRRTLSLNVYNHLPTIQKIRNLTWSLVNLLLQIHIDYPKLFCLHKHFKFAENFWINFVLVCCSYWLYASILITVCFIALFINKYNDIFLPMLRQIFLIPNRRIFSRMKSVSSQSICISLFLSILYVSLPTYP